LFLYNRKYNEFDIFRVTSSKEFFNGLGVAISCVLAIIFLILLPRALDSNSFACYTDYVRIALLILAFATIFGVISLAIDYIYSLFRLAFSILLPVLCKYFFSHIVDLDSIKNILQVQKTIFTFFFISNRRETFH
jgi:hypothetical protein